jgi:hypothetical protein
VDEKDLEKSLAAAAKDAERLADGALVATAASPR